jgi:hypothetical protein
MKVGFADLLTRHKYAQEGRFGKAERERGLPDPLLITGSGVRVPHNPLRSLLDERLRKLVLVLRKL